MHRQCTADRFKTFCAYGAVGILRIMADEGFRQRWMGRHPLAARDYFGRKTLDSGEFKIMEGPDSRWDKACSTSCVFDEASEALLKERVTNKLEAIADELGIKLFMSGRDYPVHATPHYGFHAETDKAKRDAIFKQVYADPNFKKSTEAIPGKTITFKYLRIHNGILTLDAAELAPELEKVRSEFDRASREHGVSPISRDNIIHISIAQITDVPEEDRAEIFSKFKGELIKLRHEISSSPIEMKVEHLWNGSDIMYRQRAEL